MKIPFVLLFIGLIELFFFSPVFSALPPALQTKEEQLWNQLSEKAKADLNSPETGKLMGEFLKTYPNYPKAVNVQYIKAEREFKKGNFQDAAGGFERFVAEHRRHALADSAAFRAGECYYNLKAYESARSAWQSMVARYKRSALVPDAMERLAMIQMRSDNWGKADEHMLQMKRKYPGFAAYPRNRENRGIILYNLKEFEEGSRTLEGIKTSKSMFFRGLSLFSLGMFEASVAALENFEIASPGLYMESMAFLRAEGFFKKKNYDLALSGFSDFVRSFPDSPLVTYALLRSGICALVLNEPERAIRAVEPLKSSPFRLQTYALFIEGTALLQSGSYSAAADVFERVSKRKEFANLAAASLVRKAWCHRNLKEFQAYEQSLKAVEEKFPNTPEMKHVRFLQGIRNYENERWEDAGANFEAAWKQHAYSDLSEVALALMALSYFKGNRLDHLVTSAHSGLRIFEKSYSAADPYWRAQSHYFIGNAYFNMKKYKQAIPFLEKVAVNLSEHPLAPQAQLILAWSLLEIQKFEKAREKADELIENKAIDKKIVLNAQFLCAASFFNGKQYDKALARLSEFVQKNQSHSLAPTAQYLVGLSYHQKKVYGSAIEQWNECIELYPEHPLAQEAYLHIGTLYFKAGDFKKSAQFFKKFRERWPASNYASQAFWQELQSYFNGKDDEVALRAYPAYIQKYPKAENIEDARKQLEMIYYRRGIEGDPDKIQEFLAKFPQSPMAPSARFKLGSMAIEQKKWTLVVKEMGQYVRDYPNQPQIADAHFALGEAYESLEDHPKAIVQYRTLTEHFASKPTGVNAAFRLGALYFNQANFAQALEHFKLASGKKISRDLKANVYYNMALCHENLGQLENAAAAYEKFARYSNDAEQSHEALMQGGLLLKKVQNFGRASDYFKKVLKNSRPGEVELKAISLLGECYRLSGKVTPAIKVLQKLIGMQPASSDVRLAGLAQLAYLYEQEKAFEQALKVYEKISVSSGRKEWVLAAQERAAALNKNLNPMP